MAQEPPAKKKKLESPKTDAKNFKKTSPVDLKAIDVDGKNVLHHLIAPVEAGGWLRVAEILEILILAGADFKRKDRYGMSPLDYAKKNGQWNLVEVMGEPMDEDAMKIDPKWNAIRSDHGREAVEKAGGTVKIEEDAKEYLAKVRREKEEAAAKNKDKIAEEKRAKRLRPHKSSGYADLGEIVVDSSAGQSEDGTTSGDSQPYDVFLNRVDFQYGLYGFYNYYRMQLIRRKGSDLYILFTHWGRIGDNGQYQKTPFPKLADAVKEFKSIFRQKTGNDWSPDIMKKFVEHPKKYRLINKEEDEKVEEASSALDVPIVLETSVKSALPSHLQKLMDELADVKALTSGAKRIFRNTRFDLTITALKREAVLKADAILNDIGEKLKKLEDLRKEAHDKDKLDEAMKIYHELANLSTEFYFLLPLKGFERSGLPIIEDLSKWSENKSAVEQLLKFEIANHLLCAAAGRRLEIHPYDYIYTAVGTRLERLNEDDQESQMVLHYIRNTTDGDPEVTGIYKLWNEEHSRRYLEMAEKKGNRWLMWHGTKAANVLSILQAGLMIAPPQALHTGHLFGKGIYVADAFEKSANYCEESKNGKKFAFLCEVALGKIARLVEIGNIDTAVDPLPAGYDSLQGIGRKIPYPAFDFALENGVKIPLGYRVDQVAKCKSYCWLQQNEFIVYNPDQISLRYMIVFE